MNVADFRLRQDAALRPLEKLIRAVLHIFGVPVTERQRQEVAVRLYQATLEARDLNLQITRRYLASLDLPPDLVIPPVRPYPYAALVGVLERAVSDMRAPDGSPITEDNRADITVIEKARTVIDGHLTRQAQEPARETIAHIGEKDERYGWARVLVGATSCGFCAMLASRGPVYTSKQAALGRGDSGLGAFHVPRLNENGKTVGGKCDCVAVLVPKGSTSWEGYDAHQALEKLWQDTTEGVPYTESPNAFRREWDKLVKAEKTGDYLPESIKAQHKPKSERAGGGSGAGGKPLLPPVVVGQQPFGDDSPPPEIDAPAMAHVLDGDPDDLKKGGHRFGTGRPGKTEFPQNWSGGRVAAAVRAAMHQPEVTIHSGDRSDHLKEVDGVIVRVSTYFQDGVRKFRTAYPVNGNGVVRNPEDGGGPVVQPLDRDVIERYR